MFTRYTTNVQTALTMIQDDSEILGFLLDGGHSIIAGRLPGAFLNIGRDTLADEIVKAMHKAMHALGLGFDYAVHGPGWLMVNG